MTMIFAYWVSSLVFIPFLICTVIEAYTERKLLNDDKQYVMKQKNIPICVTNGTKNIIFSNKNLLKDAMKIRNDLQRTSLRDCLYDCNLICYDNFEPVCVVNSENDFKYTFKNICELVKSRCTKKKEWKFYKNTPCSESVPQHTIHIKRSIAEKRRTPIPCPKIFSPVCATLAGVKSTFINECLVNAENVKFDKEWIVFSEGVCAEDYIYDAPRLPKIKRSLNLYSFHDFDEKMFVGEDAVHIRAAPAFQTQFIKQNTAKLINDGTDPFKYHQIYQPTELPFHQLHNHYKNLFSNFDNENESIEQKSPISFDALEPKHNSFNTPLNRIVKSSENITQPKPNETLIDTSNCKLGNSTLCCSFQKRRQTFKNICELNLHNENTDEDWEILYEGECSSCNIDCPKTFDPICAARKELQYTIRNECMLKFAMCRDKQGDWEILKKGICDDDEVRIVKDKYESKPFGFNFISTFKKTPFSASKE